MLSPEETTALEALKGLLQADPKTLSAESLTHLYAVLLAAQKPLDVKLEAVKDALKARAKEEGTPDEKGGYRWCSDDTVVTIEARITKMPPVEEVKKGLAKANIALLDACDEEKAIVPNLAKLMYLQDVGALPADFVTKLQKVTLALKVEASPTVLADAQSLLK